MNTFYFTIREIHTIKTIIAFNLLAVYDFFLRICLGNFHSLQFFLLFHRFGAIHFLLEKTYRYKVALEVDQYLDMKIEVAIESFLISNIIYFSCEEYLH